MPAQAKRKQSPAAFQTALLTWYDAAARALPWRTPPADSAAGVRPDPYHVWLSEIMLQQTVVKAVIGYFNRFVTRWPTVEALAAAASEDVMTEWAGLGYYARARNLVKCARLVTEEKGGVFPDTEEGLLELPGVGPYTAAAIAAIAFGRPAVVVDGNIERVMARLHAVETPLPDAKPALKSHAAALTPKARPGDHAQALMDLGATICTPKSPACGICPVRRFCEGQRLGIAPDLPKKKPNAAKPTRRGVAFVITRPDGAVFLERRPEKGLLGGMLGAPTTPWAEDTPDAKAHQPLAAMWGEGAPMVTHTFTHFHLQLDVWRASVSARAAAKLHGEWVEDWRSAGLPTLMRKVFEAAFSPSGEASPGRRRRR